MMLGCNEIYDVIDLSIYQDLKIRLIPYLILRPTYSEGISQEGISHFKNLL